MAQRQRNRPVRRIPAAVMWRRRKLYGRRWQPPAPAGCDAGAAGARTAVHACEHQRDPGVRSSARVGGRSRSHRSRRDCPAWRLAAVVHQQVVELAEGAQVVSDQVAPTLPIARHVADADRPVYALDDDQSSFPTHAVAGRVCGARPWSGLQALELRAAGRLRDEQRVRGTVRARTSSRGLPRSSCNAPSGAAAWAATFHTFLCTLASSGRGRSETGCPTSSYDR